MSDHPDASLYCNEDLAGDAVRSDADTTPPPPIPSDESTFIARLLDTENNHMPRPDYIHRCQNRSINVTSRQDAVNSILMVHAHFQFKQITAFLAINYFDRFLSAHTLPESAGWPFQLLLVTCLSLAAKMEEIYVPLLSDLQMHESAYVFEPKTIQKMELFVLAKLKWNLRSVTPFDYLHYFISMLPSSASNTDSTSAIHSIASSIILNTTRVVDFLGFPPSAIAAAAVIAAAGDGVNLPDTFDERINREMVRSCHQLMDEYVLDTCPSDRLKVLSIEPLEPPPSPLGVLDAAACVSCDTHPENPASFPGLGSGSGSGSDLGSGSGSSSGSDEAERENKRQRLSTPDVHES